ncbi:MAG: hypothetical protein RIF33_00560 [Cyclobacteriaceae bacterium]
MNIRHLLLSLVAIAMLNVGHAQVKTISLKKGEALDLLLLSTNKDAGELQKEYFDKAVPVAMEWGYQPQYSSRLSQPPTQGNYWPSVLILAKWKDYDRRVQFPEEIVKIYPQFHERRREIWTNFDLTYWKIEEDKEVAIQETNFYVATSYWSKSNGNFDAFVNEWQTMVANQGGKVVLKCTEGVSPLGYHYNPEVFTITEWRSKEDFEKFHAKNLDMDHTGVEHVNQFILQ